MPSHEPAARNCSEDKYTDMAFVAKLFGGAKTPALPPAPPPPPTRDDPAIAESRKKLRASELRRKGRRASIITGGAGVLGEAPLIQPQARGAQLLGG